MKHHRDLPASRSPLGGGTRIHHVGVGVRDLTASIRWYEEMLDCVCAARFENPDLHVTFAMMHTPGGDRFELIDMAGAEDRPFSFAPAPVAAKMRGFSHLAFEVPDVDLAVAELRQRGATIVSDPVNSSKLPIRIAYFLDLDGALIELVGHATPVEQLSA